MVLWISSDGDDQMGAKVKTGVSIKFEVGNGSLSRVGDGIKVSFFPFL